MFEPATPSAWQQRTLKPQCAISQNYNRISLMRLQVLRDMLWQQEWVRIMRPVASMLKFRLPWADGATPCAPLHLNLFIPAFVL
jgi:hypothetical protein